MESNSSAPNAPAQDALGPNTRMLTEPDPDSFISAVRQNVVMGTVRLLPALPFSVLVHWRFQKQLCLFRNPKTFTEMIVHRKLTDRNPLLTKTADKYAVREFVAQHIDEQYLIPLQQVVASAEDLDFGAMHGKVIIKGTHGCNMTMMVDADQPVDEEAIRSVGRKWLKKRWYPMWKEWAYKNIPPRLIVEQFIGTNNEPPADYKFHVMRGRVEFIQVDHGRFTNHRSTMVRRDWRLLAVEGAYGAETESPPQPENIAEMIDVAEKLGASFEYVRIDLYNVNGQIYFGEVTHYPGGAAVSYNPKSFELAIGELWRLGTPIPDELIVGS